MNNEPEIIEKGADFVEEIQSFYFWAYKYDNSEKIWLFGPYDSKEEAYNASLSRVNKKKLVKLNIYTQDI